MEEVNPSHSITGKTLAQDVYNEKGLLLLPRSCTKAISACFVHTRSNGYM
jgi:hypothetical protein